MSEYRKKLYKKKLYTKDHEIVYRHRKKLVNVPLDEL